MDVSNLATKTELTTVKNKIPDVSGLATKIQLTAVENKIPDISGLAAKTALTNLSNTVPDISTLVTKCDYDSEITKLNIKYVNLGKANVNATKIANTKINVPENKMKKLQTFYLSYFRGKSHFEEEGTQHYFVFKSLNKYLTLIGSTKYISTWISKGLSDETIKPIATYDKSVTPSIDYHTNKTRVNFNGSILRQPKTSYTHQNIVNIYILYKLGASGSNHNDPTLKRCVSGAVTLTKNADIDKYDILVIKLDLIEDRVFHFWSVDLVKMY